MTDLLYNTNLLINICGLPLIGWSELPSKSTQDDIYFKEWIDYLDFQHYFDNARKVYVGLANPNLTVFVMGYTYGINSVKTWSAFRYFTPNAGIYRFGYNNGSFYFGLS